MLSSYDTAVSRGSDISGGTTHQTVADEQIGPAGRPPRLSHRLRLHTTHTQPTSPLPANHAIRIPQGGVGQTKRYIITITHLRRRPCLRRRARSRHRHHRGCRCAAAVLRAPSGAAPPLPRSVRQHGLGWRPTVLPARFSGVSVICMVGHDNTSILPVAAYSAARARGVHLATPTDRSATPAARSPALLLICTVSNNIAVHIYSPSL
jgi:hypothetical protein